MNRKQVIAAIVVTLYVVISTCLVVWLFVNEIVNGGWRALVCIGWVVTNIAALKIEKRIEHGES